MKQEMFDLLKPYGSVFSKPQFNHFCGFINLMSVCEIPSLNRFCALHNKSRSSLNRFLTKSPWEIEEIKSVYHNQLFQHLPNKSFLLIDDTISHRPYAIKVEKANWHYDHTIGKKSLGYSLVTSTVRSDESIIPYDIIPYYRKEDCLVNQFKSKNEIAEKIILSTEKTPQINLVIFDTWYSNDKVINACKQAKKNYITQIKSNRNITINHEKNAVRSFVKHIKKDQWSIFKHNNDIFRIFSTSAFISKIGSIHLIFSQIYNKKSEKWGETYYIISDLLKVESQQVIENYLTRVGIEGFHREAKQNTGLEGYFLRNNRGIEKYLFLVMLTYATLVLQGLSNKSKATIGELCEEEKVKTYERVYEIIRGDPTMKKTLFKKLAKARV